MKIKGKKSGVKTKTQHSPRRHGVTEKNSGKKKVKSKSKIENPRTAENIEKSSRASRKSGQGGFREVLGDF